MSEYAKLENELRDANERIRHLEAIIDASKVINSTLDLDHLLSLILRTAVENTCAEAGTIYLIDEEQGEIWSEVARGTEKFQIRLPLGKGIAGHVAVTGETINLKNAYDDPRFLNSIDDKTGFVTSSMLCMPMLNETSKVIGVFQLLNKKKGTFGTEDEEFLNALSVHAALAVEKAKAFKEAVEMKEMEDELVVAADIQRRLLPSQLPSVNGYDFAVSNMPSEWVGGDYYDLVELSEGKISFIIADVCGKGIPASLLMASLRAALHAQTLIHGMSSPAVLIKRLNRLIYNSTPAAKFITAFYGELDTKNGFIRYVNAGHNPPFHMLPSGEHNLLRVGGLTLGLVEKTNFVTGQIAIGKGEMIVMYTDGVTEAMNPDGEEFGEERLAGIVKRNRDVSAAELVETIQRNLEEFVSNAPQHDDITLLIITRDK